MTDEPAAVHVTHGPYAGQRLTMSKHDADAAISEGWAIDPFKPVEEPKDEKKEEHKESEPTPEQAEHAKIVEHAEKAARRLRGEEDDKEKDKDKEKEKEKEKSMKPQHEGGYETRDAKPPTSPPVPPVRSR